jgi:hypothetical protein
VSIIQEGSESGVILGESGLMFKLASRGLAWLATAGSSADA